MKVASRQAYSGSCLPWATLAFTFFSFITIKQFLGIDLFLSLANLWKWFSWKGNRNWESPLIRNVEISALTLDICIYDLCYCLHEKQWLKITQQSFIGISALASEIPPAPTIPSQGWQVLSTRASLPLPQQTLPNDASILSYWAEMQQENPFGYCVLSSHYNWSEMLHKMTLICHPCSMLMRSTVCVWVQVPLGMASSEILSCF